MIWILNDGRIARRSYINPQEERKKENDGMNRRSWYPSKAVLCELSSCQAFQSAV